MKPGNLCYIRCQFPIDEYGEKNSLSGQTEASFSVCFRFMQNEIRIEKKGDRKNGEKVFFIGIGNGGASR